MIDVKHFVPYPSVHIAKSLWNASPFSEFDAAVKDKVFVIENPIVSGLLCIL